MVCQHARAHAHAHAQTHSRTHTQLKFVNKCRGASSSASLVICPGELPQGADLYVIEYAVNEEALIEWQGPLRDQSGAFFLEALVREVLSQGGVPLLVDIWTVRHGYGFFDHFTESRFAEVARLLRVPLLSVSSSSVLTHARQQHVPRCAAHQCQAAAASSQRAGYGWVRRGDGKGGRGARSGARCGRLAEHQHDATGAAGQPRRWVMTPVL